MSTVMNQIPSMFVPVNYMIDPETEDVILGDRLQTGMIIVAEDFIFRGDPDLPNDLISQVMDPLRCARWCEITDITFGQNEYGRTVSFVALYPDGTKHVRYYSCKYGWIVKKSSISKHYGG